MEIYDRCLSTFQLGPTEGKLQDECFQLFFVLAEVESKIVTLVMEHECLDEDGKREFWTLASITGATGQDEELLRALSVAPFGYVVDLLGNRPLMLLIQGTPAV